MKESIKLQFVKEGAPAEVTIQIDQYGKIILSGNVENLEVRLPYEIFEGEVVLLPNGSDRELLLSFESDSVMNCPAVIIRDNNIKNPMTPAAFFISLGDLDGERPELSRKLCVWGQDGLGNWNKRHLITTRQISEENFETSRK